jgi:ribosome maturation factor RimP
MNLEASSKSQVLEKIENFAQEIAHKEGVILYDLELAQGPQGQVLRIYIDKEGGVSIDDCANVSRGVNEFLDTNDPIPQANYSLEVSSPGIERPLKKKWHFEKAVGQTVWIKLGKALENFGCQDGKYKPAKTITESLKLVESDVLCLQLGTDEIRIPLADVEKAKIIYSFKESTNDKKPNKKAQKK